MLFPLKIKSKALINPITLGALCVPPSPGKKPSFTSGKASLLCVLITLCVQAKASSNPPPIQAPLI